MSTTNVDLYHGDIFDYSSRPFPTDVEQFNQQVAAPSYSGLLDWLSLTTREQRPCAYDLWARGNYTRRLIVNRRERRHPLIVPFSTVGQLRTAYRKLALIGTPVEFVYFGQLTGPFKIDVSVPTTMEKMGGWGFVLAAPYEAKGIEWLRALGAARLMPEFAVKWIITEARDAFARGDVFVSSAEHVGLHRDESNLDMLSAVSGGTTVRNGLDRGNNILRQLQFPTVERMSDQTFNRFVKEHAKDFERFQRAFGKVIANSPDANSEELLAELREEVRTLNESNSHASMRRTLTKLGAVLTTASAGIAASVSVNPELVVPAVATAGATSASAMLTELWKQRTDDRSFRRQNPFSLALDFGWRDEIKTAQFQSSKTRNRVERMLQPNSELANYHWLCPPTDGVLLALVRMPTTSDTPFPIRVKWWLYDRLRWRFVDKLELLIKNAYRRWQKKRHNL